MTKTISAIFDGHVLRPEAPLDLAPNTRCQVTVETLSDDSKTGNALDVLDQVAGSVEAPTDWSSEHDHYLYGTPKRRP